MVPTLGRSRTLPNTRQELFPGAREKKKNTNKTRGSCFAEIRTVTSVADGIVSSKVPLLNGSSNIRSVVGPDPTRDEHRAVRRAGGAPPARRTNRGTEPPTPRNRVEHERARECRNEVVGGGGEEDQVARNRHGLDGQVSGQEGRVAKHRAEKRVGRWGQGLPII